MTYTNETDTIEAGIERERASLASTLGALQDRVSVDHLAKEALGLVKTNAAAYTRSIDSAVRANPLALALTGVGIAWLVFGGKKAEEPQVEAPMERWEDEGGSGFAFADGAAPTEDEWQREIDQLRDSASSTLSRIDAEARRHAEALRRGAADTLSKARDFAAERGAVLGDFAEGMKKSFRSGLGDLSDAAREKIAAAREQAYAARVRGERVMRGGTREAGRLIEDYPLVAGVAALAAGAAFAAALPRTETEDRAFGSESDRLTREATRLLREERARLGRVAAGVADELKQSSRDLADTIAGEVKDASRSHAAALSDKLSEDAEAVKDRAAKEAGDIAAAATAAAGPSKVKDKVG
ncbi:DUF3618 domain-containing protein [Frigidibacter sp. SD6-1]|uniref:DUF3618 domain-containing protein n=1 Tax=Frigidibacter sp. SD6-1 TaxID=3032581 RepID=UPI0024DF3903|nr:DUF3618 domain-containing protein [Frigidibacter sp. SD6-1]